MLNEDLPVFLYTSSNGEFCEAINISFRGIDVYKIS